MEKAHVEYPCWWTYAIIGSDEEDLRMAAGDVAKGMKHKVEFSKLSEKKRYASLHVEIWVGSEDERNRLFQAFQSDARVKIVI